VESPVSSVVFAQREPQRRDYLDQLRAFANEGVRSTRVESLIVFDTRSLWQARSGRALHDDADSARP